MKLLLSRIPCPSTSKHQLPTITTPADHTITVANDLLQLLRFLCQLIFLVQQLSSFRRSVSETALRRPRCRLLRPVEVLPASTSSWLSFWLSFLPLCLLVQPMLQATLYETDAHCPSALGSRPAWVVFGLLNTLRAKSRLL